MDSFFLAACLLVLAAFGLQLSTIQVINSQYQVLNKFWESPRVDVLSMISSGWMRRLNHPATVLNLCRTAKAVWTAQNTRTFQLKYVMYEVFTAALIRGVFTLPHVIPTCLSHLGWNEMMLATFGYTNVVLHILKQSRQQAIKLLVFEVIVACTDRIVFNLIDHGLRGISRFFVKALRHPNDSMKACARTTCATFRGLKKLIMDPKPFIKRVYNRLMAVFTGRNRARTPPRRRGHPTNPRLPDVHENHCLICFGPLEKAEPKLKCGHSQFHATCLFQWLMLEQSHGQCPMPWCEQKLSQRKIIRFMQRRDRRGHDTTRSG